MGRLAISGRIPSLSKMSSVVQSALGTPPKTRNSEPDPRDSDPNHELRLDNARLPGCDVHPDFAHVPNPWRNLPRDTVAFDLVPSGACYVFETASGNVLASRRQAHRHFESQSASQGRNGKQIASEPDIFSVVVLRDPNGASICDGIRQIRLEVKDNQRDTVCYEFKLNPMFLKAQENRGDPNVAEEGNRVLSIIRPALKLLGIDSGNDSVTRIKKGVWQRQVLKPLLNLTLRGVGVDASAPLIQTTSKNGEPFIAPKMRPFPIHEIPIPGGDDKSKKEYTKVVIERLKEWLTHRHVNFSQWGITPGTRGLESLAKEVISGESWLSYVIDPAVAISEVFLERKVVMAVIASHSPKNPDGSGGELQLLVEDEIITIAPDGTETSRPGRKSHGGYAFEKLHSYGGRPFDPVQLKITESHSEAIQRLGVEELGFGLPSKSGRELLLVRAHEFSRTSAGKFLVSVLSALLPEKLRARAMELNEEVRGLGPKNFKHLDSKILSQNSSHFPGIAEGGEFYRYGAYIPSEDRREEYFEKTPGRRIVYRWKSVDAVQANLDAFKEIDLLATESRKNDHHAHGTKPGSRASSNRRNK